MPAPKFTIAYEDGSTEVVRLLPKAQLKYEKETKRSLREDVGSITEMYELAWYAAGKPDGNLEAWVERVEEIVAPEEEEDDEGHEVPTSTSS